MKNHAKNPPMHDLLQELDLPLMLKSRDESLRRMTNKLCDLIESQTDEEDF